jgi:hypothetical protein
MLITPNADGMYEICGFQNILTAGTSGNLVLRFDFEAEGGAAWGNLLTTSITTSNTWNRLCWPFYAKSGTAITYQTSFSGTPGAATYSLHIRLKRLD